MMSTSMMLLALGVRNSSVASMMRLVLVLSLAQLVLEGLALVVALMRSPA